MKTRKFSGWDKAGIPVLRAAVLTWALTRAVSASTCVPVPAGAVAWWRAESNTLDSISINDATFVSQLPRLNHFTPGKVGLAFWFRLYGDYLTNAVSEELDVGAGAGFTVEGWINIASGMITYPIIGWLTTANNYFAPGVALVFNSAFGNVPVLKAYLSETNSQMDRVTVLQGSLPAMSNRDWQHVALTFDKASGVAAIFHNGIALAQTNLGPFRPQTRLPVVLGRASLGASSFLGALDEFTIYNRALAVAEIQAIVAADSAGKCPPPPPVCTPPPSDFVAWWRGESNALDYVDSNDGVITQSVRFGAGRVGNGFELSQGSVRVPSSSNLDVGSGPGLTIETWMKPEWFYHEYRPIAQWNSGTGLRGVSFAHGWFGALRADLVDASGRSHQIFTPWRILTLSIWQHVAVTYDKGSGRAALYLGGFPVVQTNLGVFTPQTSWDFYLGSDPHPSGGWQANLDGSLDEVSLYARALSADEIKAIVKARDLGKCKDPPVVVTQPASLRVNVSAEAQFAVVATGNPRLRYQWLKGGAPLAGATNAMLTLTNVQVADAETYAVHVTNWFGSALSSNVALTVNHPPVADASATVTRVLSPLHGPAMVVLDGSRTSDPDDDPLNYSWWLGADPLATGVVAVVRLPAGNAAISLVVNDGLTQSTNVIAMDILTPAQALERLTDVVSAGVRRSQPLLATLRAALASLNRDNPTPAMNQLQALQNKVRAQVAPGDPILADTLVRLAQEVIDALGHAAPGGLDRVQIHEATRQADGKFRVKFSGGSGRVCIVEASTDLMHWEAIGVARNTGQAVFDFEDVHAAQFPGRFYRVVWP